MNRELNKLFKELLLSLSDDKNINSKLTGFLGIKGENYNSKMVIIGRAVNGWGKYSFKPGSSNVNRSIDNILLDNNCALSDKLHWVYKSEGCTDEYNTNKSAFWRVTKRVVLSNNYCDNEAKWSTYISWTNLYKVSYADGGNPNNYLCNKQYELCRKILCKEIELFNPKFILFLTGNDWALPLINENTTLNRSKNNYKAVESKGYFSFATKKIPIIIAKHPQGKNEDIFVDEINSIIDKKSF